MKFIEAKPEDMPIPDGYSVRSEILSSQVRTVTFLKDGVEVFKITQPSSYESLRFWKPAPPKMKKVWQLTATSEGLPTVVSNWEHKFEAENAEGKFTGGWETKIEQAEVPEEEK